MKKVVLILLSMIMFAIPVRAYEAIVVMDADSKRVLYDVNANSKYLIASTTKIMTALVAINYGKLDEIVTAGDEIMDAYGSSIYLKPQERMSLRDLIYGLLLRSGNDAALTIAVNVAGSEEGFVKLMNDTALGIGMHDTVFENPHGLDEKTENKSTVYDMALLMVEAMKSPEFRNITSAKKYEVESNFGKYEWFNKNRLISNYKYATGGKIGYTKRASHTFVSSATKDGKNLVIASFVDPDRFDTHEAMYEKYFDMYKKYTVIDRNNLNIDYKDGYRVHTKESFSILLTNAEKKKIERKVELYEDVKGAKGEQVIGTIAVVLDGEVLEKMNIYAEIPNIPKKRTFFEKLKEFFGW